MTYTFVSQDATELGLKWYPGDPVSLSWYVKGVDWHGTYTAAVRKYEDPTSQELQSFTVTATYDAVNLWTVFTLTMTQANSATIPAGQYWWSCKQAAGLTRFAGPVIIDA